MRRDTDRQPLGFTGASPQRQLRHLGHCLITARNHELRFGVQVGEINLVALHQRLNPRAGQAHNRRQSVTFRIRLFH